MSDTSSDTPAKKPVAKSEDAVKATEEAEKAPEPAPEPEPVVKETKPLPKEPRKGVYTLEIGDTPGIVSVKFHGRSHKAGELVKANPDCAWQPGDVINLV